MTSRTEFEPMSMTAIGGPWSRRPLNKLAAAAEDLTERERLRAFDEAAYKAARRGLFERFATSRQARIRHEILVGVEKFFARRRLYARRGAVRQERPALLVILEVCHHDLAQNLLVHGWVENWTQQFNASVEIA